MRLAYALVLALPILVAAGCGKPDRRDDVAKRTYRSWEPDPARALPMAWATPGFLNEDALQRCDKVREFFVAFGREHMPETQVVVEDDCYPFYSDDDKSVAMLRDVEVRGSGGTLRFTAFIYDYLNGAAEGSITARDDKDRLDFDWDPTDGHAVHPNAGRIEDTLAAWIQTARTDPRIGGLTYPAYETQLVAASQAEKGLKYSYVYHIRLHPEGATKRVEFLPSTYIGPSGVLGCPDLACLNDGSVRYELVANVLLLARVKDGREFTETSTMPLATD